MNAPVKTDPPLGLAGIEHRPDPRITPAYYTDTSDLDPAIGHLLQQSPTIFDIKRRIALLFTEHRHLLPEPRGLISPTARVNGDVIVAAGAVIEDGAMVDGPVLVCPGTVIGAGARVRDNTIVGPNCAIGFGAEITRSLLIGGIFMKHASFVGDSVIGQRVNIGAFVSTTGLRVDAGPVTEPATAEISVRLDGRRIGTGYTKFGSVVGDGVALPAGTILQPATLIGPHSMIYPKGNQVGGFIPAGSQAR